MKTVIVRLPTLAASRGPYRASLAKAYQTFRAAHTNAGPQPADEKKAIDKYFAGAITPTELTDMSKQVFGKLGFTPKSSLMAVSSCPDEINRTMDSFNDYWGDSFHLGGLAGIPFTGKTGFGAYAAHVPDNGQLLVVFAPHVGVSSDGKVGSVLRAGMGGQSGACGAAIAALGNAGKGGAVPQTHECLVGDGQQDIINKIVLDGYDQLEHIKDDDGKMAKLADVIYQKAKDEIRSIIPEEIKIPVGLIGGIQINTDYTSPSDYFLVKDVMYKAPEDTSFEPLN
ncbi:hypothetical protein AAMO2058_000660800 [Amorphochlora amoebiformis]